MNSNEKPSETPLDPIERWCVVTTHHTVITYHAVPFIGITKEEAEAALKNGSLDPTDYPSIGETSFDYRNETVEEVFDTPQKASTWICAHAEEILP